MVKSGNNNQPNVAPFLIKCYDMVDDPSTDGVISWNQSDDTFVIWNMTEFSRDLLPKFFKHQNFSSFMRQLNIYGFRKVDTDRWEFANEGFIKDQKHLLKVIKRRKHPQGASHKNPHQEQIVRSSDENLDYTKLQKEVEILKIDKSAIMQELSNLRERQESSQNKLLLLRERIQGMENDQQQLLSFLVMVMQNPSLLVQLLQPKENNWRVCDSGKITLNNDTEFGDPVFPDGVIVRYQPPSDDTSSPTPTMSPESEKTMEHDPSFDRVKDFFMNFDFPSTLDESFLSPENCASLMVPEWDLAMLEQFLLSSPSREGGDDQGQADVEELTDFEMEMEIETALAEKCQLQESACP